MKDADLNEPTKECPSCHGAGRKNCPLGSLTCGACNGTGRVPMNYGDDPTGDFVKAVRRALNKK